MECCYEYISKFRDLIKLKKKITLKKLQVKWIIENVFWLLIEIFFFLFVNNFSALLLICFIVLRMFVISQSTWNQIESNFWFGVSTLQYLCMYSQNFIDFIEIALQNYVYCHYLLKIRENWKTQYPRYLLFWNWIERVLKFVNVIFFGGKTKD